MPPQSGTGKNFKRPVAESVSVEFFARQGLDNGMCVPLYSDGRSSRQGGTLKWLRRVGCVRVVNIGKN